MTNLQKASKEWESIIGKDQIVDQKEASRKYGQTTFDQHNQYIPLAIIPKDKESLIACIKIAKKNRIGLHPISTGKNWGYGNSAPVKEGVVVLDLSRLNKIISFDQNLGLITVEPGVTVGILHEFLNSSEKKFYTPTNGAGPNTSIIGNILERGFGSSPPVDRFGSVIGLEAVLEDGSIYYSNGAGKNNTDVYYKWGVGPYLDGLFSQSSLGVVTSMTISLTPKKNYWQAFYCKTSDQVNTELIIDSLSKASLKIGNIMTLFKIYNNERLKTKKPTDHKSTGHVLLLGMLQGEKAIVRVAKKIITQEFNPHHVMSFINQKDLEKRELLSRTLPKWLVSELEHEIMIRNFINLANGEPSLSDPQIVSAENLKKTGLFFLTVALPFKGFIVADFLEEMEKIFDKNNLSFFSAIHSFSDSSVVSVARIMFDKGNPEQTRAAKRCYLECQKKCEELGLAIVRVPNLFMEEFSKADSFLNRRIKKALDPDQIFSSGKYY